MKDAVECPMCESMVSDQDASGMYQCHVCNTSFGTTPRQPDGSNWLPTPRRTP